MTLTSPCAICRGACCESLLFPYYGTGSDQDEFLKARGHLMPGGTLIEIESRCPHLKAPCGSCGIYEDRPNACRTYKVGSPLCLATIAARRPGEHGERIREAIKSIAK